MNNATTISELVGNLIKKNKSKLLLQRRDGWSWKQITWLDFDSEVKNVASFLLSLGFKPGDCALVISSNSNECLVSELAVYSLGGRVIPFSDYNAFSEYNEVVSSIKPRFIFSENEDFTQDIKSNTKLLKYAEKIFVFDDCKLGENNNIVPYKAAVKFGQIRKKKLADNLDKISEQIKPEQVALTLYTKNENGIQALDIDHKKMIELLNGAYDRLKFISSEDQSYCYLSSCNLFEKLINILAISLGIRIIIAEDKKCFYEDILEAKPTIIFESKSGIEDVYNKLNGSNLKKMLGGRVQYLITDELPAGDIKDAFKKSKISIIAISQFVSSN
jgi:long-chain acyl-CoA synthetase